jgi:hypothetical protein
MYVDRVLTGLAAVQTLSDQGLDAGAYTTAFHLARRHEVVPCVATIWRILTEGRMIMVVCLEGLGSEHT